MHLNVFAPDADPLEMEDSDEFGSLLQSASDLGIAFHLPANYRSQNYVLRHMRFHCLRWGSSEKPPLVLLHGGHQSAHSWDLVSLALSHRFQIFAPDQRGHGDTEWARDKDYSPETMAEDALALITQLGLNRPIVMGHSMGGMVTMALLKHHPEVASAAVLVDIGPEISTSGTATIRNFVETAAEFDDLDTFVTKVGGYDPFRSRTHIERTARYNLIQRTDGKFVTKCDQRFIASGREQVVAPRVTLDETRDFKLPVLVVRGAQSNVLEPDAAERFAEALPNGRLVTVDKCGHNVHSQNTVGFLEAVSPFLDSVSAR